MEPAAVPGVSATGPSRDGAGATDVIAHLVIRPDGDRIGGRRATWPELPVGADGVGRRE